MEPWRKDLYLAHHGIKGQKWGVRNGPPYPLGASDHSASEKKAGWRKSLDKPAGSRNTDEPESSEDRVVLARKGETVNHVKAKKPFKTIKDGRALYVSKSQEDLETYLSTLAMDRDNFSQNVYNTKLTVLEDLVSPSETARVKEFIDLYSDHKVSMARDIAKAKREFSIINFRSEDSLTKNIRRWTPKRCIRFLPRPLLLT